MEVVGIKGFSTKFFWMFEMFLSKMEIAIMEEERTFEIIHD